MYFLRFDQDIQQRFLFQSICKSISACHLGISETFSVYSNFVGYLHIEIPIHAVINPGAVSLDDAIPQRQNTLDFISA
jgi:hypothetical protein